MDNQEEVRGDQEGERLRVLADNYGRSDGGPSDGGPDRPDGDDTDRIEAFWAGRNSAMRRSGRSAA
jgi:hypothetical protein